MSTNTLEYGEYNLFDEDHDEDFFSDRQIRIRIQPPAQVVKSERETDHSPFTLKAQEQSRVEVEVVETYQSVIGRSGIGEKVNLSVTDLVEDLIKPLSKRWVKHDHELITTWI